MHSQGVFEGAAKVFEAFFCVYDVVEHVAELAGELDRFFVLFFVGCTRVG